MNIMPPRGVLQLPLTPLALHAWEQAIAEAATLYHTHLGTEHLLIALTRARGGYTDRLLASLDREPHVVRAQVRGRAGVGSASRYTGAPPQPTPRMSQVVHEAITIAAGSAIDERALLLGILRAGPGVAVRMLVPTADDLDAIIAQVEADAGPEAPHLFQPDEERPEPEALPVKPEQRSSATPTLDRFGRDLTALARAGKLRPLVGRRHEWAEIAQALARQERNVPVLVGEPGVGKTAIVEGLAERIIHHPERKVVEILRDRRIVELRMSDIEAGAGIRGEFEERLQQIMRECAAHPEIIVFLDEIHTLVGAGHSGSNHDAAQILKPALARGEMRIIGATTPAEYERWIARDPALERRMQVIQIAEPTAGETLELLQALAPGIAAHYGVVLQPEAVESAIALAVRYLPEQRLPAKALDLVDMACARGVVGDQVSMLGDIEDATITPDDISAVLAQRLNVPLQALTASESERLLNLERTLGRRVFGQESAVHTVAQFLKVRLALGNNDRPRAVLLLAGPTGVGKTELARALAEALFVGPAASTMKQIDMGEFHLEHAQARLIGSPPGFVNSDQEGELAAWLRRHPYSVVLFDEIEKAHPAVLDLLLGLFDTGRLTDGLGRPVMGREAIFIMTTNLLSKPGDIGFVRQPRRGDTQPLSTEAALRERLRENNQMRPELVNRIDRVVLFSPLELDQLKRIVQRHIDALSVQLDMAEVDFRCDDTAKTWLAERGQDPASGARAIQRAFERFVEPPVAQLKLEGRLKPGTVVRLRLQDDQLALVVE